MTPHYGAALRIARHTDQLAAVTSFYRDRVGFPELGGFHDHDGYDGVFLAVPGTCAHLELTSGGSHGAPEPHPESLLVVYLETQAQIDVIATRIAQRPIVPANPYWRDQAVAFADPDGFQLLLALRDTQVGTCAVRIEPHLRPRAELRSLFELAEDSDMELDSYIELGRVLVALAEDRVVGHIQIVDPDGPAAEIKNMAVVKSHRGQGIGRALLATAIELARDDGRETLLVATAAADVDNLHFYQRAGFRMRSIERDAFTPATGYAARTMVDGVELRDRVWLDLELGMLAASQ